LCACLREAAGKQLLELSDGVGNLEEREDLANLPL
jgi:hypothetical protein